MLCRFIGVHFSGLGGGRKRDRDLNSSYSDGISIRVKLAGIFRIDRFRENLILYPTNVTVRELVADLQLPEHLLGIVVVNDVHVGTDFVLGDGDTLALFPLLDGG